MALAVDWNAATDPWAAAVLLHPHPQYGGNRFNHVIGAMFTAFPTAGVSAARFDFSSSDPASAAAEAMEAIDAVASQGIDGPVILAGYSFGADIALSVDHERIAGWFAVAAPLAIVPAGQLVAATDPRPKRLAVPEHDQYSSPERTRGLTATWPNTTVTVIPGAEHFLGTGADRVAADAVAFSDELRREMSR